jgi:thioesterase domain-containing protein/acyl carrier protein
LVKLRGFRIELGEIEVTLSQHAAIESAIVQLYGKNQEQKRLVAYLVFANGQALTSAELRRFLKKRLPEYMVPSEFIFLESLPLLPNGKVNRRGLPDPENLDPVEARALVPPRDEIESRLIEIWKSLLGTISLGVQDNFFDVGGHSLLLTRLLHEIEDAFGKTLTFTDVFEAPTVEQLAEIVRGQTAPSPREGIMPIQAQGDKTPFFWIRGGPLFLPLSRLLGTERPSLGVYLPSSKASSLPPYYSLQDLAAALIDVIRQVRPHGPYYLGGLCINGVLSYEMAQQLSAQGEQVPLVILYDSQNPVTYLDFSRQGRVGVFVRQAKFHLQTIARMKLADVSPYLRERVFELRRTYSQKKWRAYYKRGWRVPQRKLGNLDPIIHPPAFHYRPQPYAGRVIFFKSSEWPEGDHWDFQSGWRELVPEFEVHQVPGGHESMFDEPNVDKMASTLGSCIRQVENQQPGCGNSQAPSLQTQSPQLVGSLSTIQG